MWSLALASGIAYSRGGFKNAMIVSFFRRRSRFPQGLAEVPGPAWGVFVLSVLAGLVAGGGGAGLLAYINNMLTVEDRSNVAMETSFWALCALVLAAGILSEWLALRLTQNMLFKMRLWLCRRILSAPLRQLQACGAHRLMAALTDDVGSIARVYEAMPLLVIDVAVAVGGIIYVGCLSLKLLLVLLIFLGIGASAFFLAQARSLRWMRHAREADDALFANFQALTEGAKELKINERRRRAFIEEELTDAADRIRTSMIAGLTIFIVGAQSSRLLFFVAIGLALFGPALTEGASSHVASGWTLAILFIMSPISTIVNTAPIVGQGLVAMRKIAALGLSMSPEESTGASIAPMAISSRPGALELVGVTHSYRSETDGSKFTLGPIELRIEPGELLFITGGNGSGKTTLAFLLLGLFAPEQGMIKLDGEPVTGDRREAFRQNFAAVFADAFNFQALLGYRDPASLAKATQLLRTFELHHKVEIRNGRFSTVDLSRGQRKRLALLTAFVEDKPFYLFDEWAAEQDPIFRNLFYTEILSSLKARGKTVIVITHDDRYYHVADRILRLGAGAVEQIMDAHGPAERIRRSSERSG
ncbi:cyclic peptide export ABC transporter [Methylocapsa acidiphila]|uniref:cyclic peptide export ABC transporter n=1 Tax=Methylocapsa acidiphila TaxID=133552 RepID=UPI00068432EE|nr:cyclic peptide export ABC transporter [Methylocapsa acidiphila]